MASQFYTQLKEMQKMTDKLEQIALWFKAKNDSVRKRLGIRGAFFWCTARKQSIAQSRALLAMDEAGFDEDDFARPVRVNLPVVNDLPEEGAFDTAFCDRYEPGGEDGITMTWIPGTKAAQEHAPAATAQAEEPDPTPEHTEDFGAGAAASNAVEGDVALYPTMQLRLPQRVISQYISEKHTYHVTQAQRIQIGQLEMDDENAHVQNLLLCVRNHKNEVDDLKIPALHDFVYRFKKVFPPEKRHELCVMAKFVSLYFQVGTIDRGILTREWAAGNRISVVGDRVEPWRNDSEEQQSTAQQLDDEPATPKTVATDSATGDQDAGTVDAESSVETENTASNEGEKSEVKSGAQIMADAAPELAAAFSSQNQAEVSHSEPETQQNAPEVQQTEPAAQWPTHFEPGRYEGIPNDVYHAANGISSTMVKDARISLMYYNARHVAKTITKERSKVLDMGNLVHALALQPEILDEEFSIEPVIPEGALTTTATIRAVIDEYNNALPVLLSSDDIKRFIEEYNTTLPSQIPMGGDLNETGQSYMSLPSEFQRIEEGQKQTATAMKACIKEYNATLPPQMKTSGSRDALLEQLAIINPDLVAQEAQKPQPLKVSGTKTDLIQAVKSVKPDAVFADELLDAWRENPGNKILVTRQQYATALAIQAALYAHPEAGALLTNPTRAVEVSYFGIDEETGLEIRTRPDVEIEYEGLRIGFDLKTISMWDVKENQLKARLHREIIMRDYHLSAGMYCENSSLDKFAWIFVNKDEGYHWVAVVWASASELELGALEYHYTMRAIANSMDTGEWPAPITEDYIDELSDIDQRRLDALREMA